MQAQAVIFDFDGLLVDTECLARRAWELTAIDSGVDVSAELVASLVGLRVPDIRQALIRQLASEALADELLSICQAHLLVLLDSGPPVLKPGAHEILDLLEHMALPRALATSSLRERFTRKIGGTGLESRFEIMVCGDEIKRGKPAPDIFLEAARLLEVDRSACFVLEDSGPGIQAAAHAGMRPLLVPDHGEPAPETVSLAEAVFEDLHAAADYIRRRTLRP